MDAGADALAVDNTRRPRPDQNSLADVVAGLARYAPDVLVMADCGSRTHPSTMSGWFVNALDPAPQEGH